MTVDFNLGPFFDEIQIGRGILSEVRERNGSHTQGLYTAVQYRTSRLIAALFLSHARRSEPSIAGRILEDGQAIAIELVGGRE